MSANAPTRVTEWPRLSSPYPVDLHGQERPHPYHRSAVTICPLEKRVSVILVKEREVLTSPRWSMEQAAVEKHQICFEESDGNARGERADSYQRTEDPSLLGRNTLSDKHGRLQCPLTWWFGRRTGATG